MNAEAGIQVEIDEAKLGFLTPSDEADLPAALQSDEKLDALVARVSAHAQAMAEGLTTDSENERQALGRICRRIAKSKVALEEAGKALTRDMRNAVKKVNERRDGGVSKLQALQDKIGKPLAEWKAAEELRQADLQHRLDELQMPNVFGLNAAALRVEVERIEAIEIDATWAEVEAAARGIHEQTLSTLRAALTVASEREAERAELEEFRRQKAEREAEEKRTAEAKKAAEREAEQRREYFEDLIRHIEDCGRGMIGGDVYPYAILFRELEEKVVIDETWGEYRERGERARETSLELLRAGRERQRARDEEERRAAESRAAAAAREQVEREARDEIEREQRRAAAAEEEARLADERAKAAAEKAERDRIAAEERRVTEAKEAEERRAAEVEAARAAERIRIAEEQRRAEEERERRAADVRGRALAKHAIVEVIDSLLDGLDLTHAEIADVVADAIIGGKIPFCEVAL